MEEIRERAKGNTSYPDTYALASQDRRTLLCSVQALEKERDRLAGSLAACGVIARCDDAASFAKWDLPADNFAYTDSYMAVAKLRKEATAIRENVSGLQAQAKWLRIAGDEIAKAGHYGWGNTCAQAADAIDAALKEQQT